MHTKEKLENQSKLMPSLLQYRWYDDNPHTVTYGQWDEWQSCDEHKHSEIEAYIKRGNKYELRKLYVIPDDYALVPIELIERAASDNVNRSVNWRQSIINSFTYIKQKLEK